MGAVSAATAAVVQVGKHGGRGFIILVGDRRYIVRAAHCVYDKLPEPMPARDANQVTYRNLIGPLAGKRTVSAECVFIDPIADIAMFGTLDTQECSNEAKPYEALTSEAAFKIGKLKPVRRRYPARTVSFTGKPIKMPAFVRLARDLHRVRSISFAIQ